MIASKMKIIGIILLCCGIAAVLAGVIIPLWTFLFPRELDTSIGIIGGADFPRHKLWMDIMHCLLSPYVYLRLSGYGLGVCGIVLLFLGKKKA